MSQTQTDIGEGVSRSLREPQRGYHVDRGALLPMSLRTGRLIKVGERCLVSDDRKDICRVVLHVR